MWTKETRERVGGYEAASEASVYSVVLSNGASGVRLMLTTVLERFPPRLPLPCAAGVPTVPSINT